MNSRLFQLAIAALISMVLAFAATQNAAQGQPQIEWTSPPATASLSDYKEGLGYLKYGGGHISNLLRDLNEDGCLVQYIWDPATLDWYHADAPAWLQRPFVTKYTSKPIPPGTALAIYCRYWPPPSPIKLEPPAPVTIEARFDDSLTISWPSRPGANGYVVRWCNGNDCVGTTKEHRTDVSRLQLSPLSPATHFRVSVRALGGSVGRQAYLDSELSPWTPATTTPPIRSRSLDHTHIAWITSPDINTARNKQGRATIQYGGGTMYHLVSRLATSGCNVTELTIGNATYSHLQLAESAQEFTDSYDLNIPKHTNIGVHCQDSCSLFYGLELVTDPRERARITSDQCTHWDRWRLDLSLVDKSLADCDDQWRSPIEDILRILPLFQEICRVEAASTSPRPRDAVTLQSMLINSSALFQFTVPTMWISNELPFRRMLAREVHELCYMHQEWYTYKYHLDYELLSSLSVEYVTSLWKHSPMANELRDLVGFQFDSDEGAWVLPADSPYRSLQRGDWANWPFRIAAEVCSWYILEKVEPTALASRYKAPPYLTTELRQWVERYIVLPE
ncbi:MAG: fibronectin type III domain-containing protein [Chloroflexi bacterium]|nr:fibronectin type III domain-containing protein [Chloroflexota bacterium]